MFFELLSNLLPEFFRLKAQRLKVINPGKNSVATVYLIIIKMSFIIIIIIIYKLEVDNARVIGNNVSYGS